MFDRAWSIPRVLNVLELEWVVNIVRLHSVLCELCFKDSCILNVLSSEYAKVLNVSGV